MPAQVTVSEAAGRTGAGVDCRLLIAGRRSALEATDRPSRYAGLALGGNE